MYDFPLKCRLYNLSYRKGLWSCLIETFSIFSIFPLRLKQEYIKILKNKYQGGVKEVYAKVY